MVRVSECITEGSVGLKVGSGLHVSVDQPALEWLGQAGFALRYQGQWGLIDPYLSDYLERKYRDSTLSYRRMMAAPLQAEKVHDLSFVLCTHGHSDHMDPETLPVLSRHNSDCRFFVPRSQLAKAHESGLSPSCVHGVNTGDKVALGRDIRLWAVPAAHEQLQTNDQGEHLFLGYIIQCGDVAIYHSGDCCPYEGLEETLSRFAIDVALLPINGRDDFRRKNRIPGNFQFAEAVQLCRSCGIPVMIAHHFGMFACNTIDLREISRDKLIPESDLQCIIPKIGMTYVIDKT